MTVKEIILSSRVPKPVAHFDRNPYYSQANKVGNLIFISGMTGRCQDLQSKTGWNIKRGDAIAQTEQAIQNIKNVLEEVGATLKNIVKLTTYITSREYFDDVAQVLSENFVQDLPAHTLVFVPALALDDYLVEIDATAAL
jgi:enamine deaminase RidA (YjgF/YER057c/UK114 family)